jgi:cytochrome c biogenesis protein CcmG, thiol:disulfide interchange protein DsbE
MHSDSLMMTRRALLQAAGMLGVATLGEFGKAQANDLHLGQPAPPATLVTLQGEKLATAELRGHVVILTFWATWCEPCREELPLLSKYATEHASQGLQVLGFSLDLPEDLQAVRAVAQTLSFPVGLLAQSSAPGYGRIWRLPVNFTIDRDGRLVDDGWRAKKPVWTQERLDSIVTPLLTQSKRSS